MIASRGWALLAVFSVSVSFSIAQEASEKNLSDFLPDPLEELCEVRDGPLFFQPDNLYEHINGAAEAFIEYDFRQLVHQIYDCDGMEVAVDLYQMETTLDAFGIYSSERGRESEFLEIGLEGYQEGEVLNFVCDRYYLKLSAFAEDGAVGSLLRQIAEKIENRLPAGTSMPKILALFPTEGKIPHSQSYVKTAPLGHQFLSPGYLTEYGIQGKRSTLLVSPSTDEEEAAGKIDRLREHLQRGGKVAEVSASGEGAFLAASKYEGQILSLRSGRFAVVLIDPPADYEGFLDTLIIRLKEGEDLY